MLSHRSASYSLHLERPRGARETLRMLRAIGSDKRKHVADLNAGRDAFARMSVLNVKGARADRSANQSQRLKENLPIESRTEIAEAHRSKREYPEPTPRVSEPRPVARSSLRGSAGRA